MKLEKIFKKAEKFFGMDEKKQKKKVEKKDRLKFSLEKKISSMKGKIKKMENIQKKDELKSELEVLNKLLDKLK